VLRCDCGFEVRSAHDDALLAEVRRHAWEAHGMPLTLDEALLLASHTELEAQTPQREPAAERPTTPRKRS
jgi:Protein of unknown function (DUF1059)